MWAMSLQRQVCRIKKINKVDVETQLFIFQALMFYCAVDNARYADYRLFFCSGIFLFLYQMLVYPLLAKSVDHITLVRGVAVR